MKKIAFLVNRMIKKYADIVKEIESEFTYSSESKLFISTHAGHIKELAAEAHREGFEYFIVVGGDGTVNETVNGLLSRFKTGIEMSPDSYDWSGIQSIKLGLLPAGTGNDFARYHQLKFDVKHLKYLIEKDQLKKLDVGWASFKDRENKPCERFFMNITDVGMGGHTVQHMDKHKIPWISSNLNYMKAIASSFISYEKSTVKWTANETLWEGKAMSIVVANGKFFGSGMGIAPNAKMDDGIFSLVTLGDITMMDYVKNLKKVKNSELLYHPKITYNEVKKVTIASTEGKELPIDMDGDFAGYCPMTLACMQQKIAFFG